MRSDQNEVSKANDPVLAREAALKRRYLKLRRRLREYANHWRSATTQHPPPFAYADAIENLLKEIK